VTSIDDAFLVQSAISRSRSSVTPGVLRAHKLDPMSTPGSNRIYFRDQDGIILQLS
jgi:hypothetical protein